MSDRGENIISAVPLPELPSEDDARRQKIVEIRPYLLDPTLDYPEPYYMLELNGVPFSTIGGIQAMSGQKKNGKSFVFTMLIAAILRGDPERTRVPTFLPGLTVPERTIEYLGHEPRVLYVDTEMEMLNSAKVLRRVHWLCGWDMKQPNDRFNVLWLKTMPKDDKEPAHKKRFHLIKTSIEALEPDIVFIDGLRDLLASINDEETAIAILDYLSSTAEERKMCIWNALHQNPKANSDGEDTKMRGWTGTELGNKVSDTLVSIKNKTANGVTFTVKQVDARGKDLDDWKFEITDDAGSLGIPKLIGNNGGGGGGSTDRATGDAIEDVELWFREAKHLVQWPATRQTVKDIIIRGYGKQTNKTKQDIDLKMLMNKRILIESTLKQNGYFLLIPNEDEENEALPEPLKGETPF
jgi:hypothetical protein